MTNNNTYWTTEISPTTFAKGLGLKELWQKKYLIWLFVKRDITVQYKQTIFGMGWYFISPLFTMFMYIVVFGRIAGIPTDDIPQPVFYLSGICLWEYFSTCLTDTAATFQTNAGLFGKVYFPRLVTPVSKVISKLFRFSLQLSTFVFVYLYFVIRGVDLHPNIYLLLFPVLILMMQCMALGLGLIVSSLTTKYRDLTNFFGVFVSLWMYATPIVYPLSYVTNPTLHKIMLFNPMTAIIETFKYGAFGAGQFSWSSLGFSAEYESADQTKVKDPRFYNVWMDLAVRAGAAFRPSPDLMLGASLIYRSTIEQVRGGIYGTTDKQYFIFTDISKDGTLSGVNREQLKKLADATEGRANIVASGGVHTMDDIIACKEMGLYGTICGKSIYKGTLDLREAVKYAEV